MVLFASYCFTSVMAFICLSLVKWVLCTCEQISMMKDVTRLPEKVKAELDLVEGYVLNFDLCHKQILILYVVSSLKKEFFTVNQEIISSVGSLGIKQDCSHDQTRLKQKPIQTAELAGRLWFFQRSWNNLLLIATV